MPVVQYFLIIGSVLTGLLFYANSVMAPTSLPFNVSQNVGLPKPYKAPAAVAEAPRPAIIATIVESRAEVKKPVKAGRKHKPTQVGSQTIPQGRYAAYPPREFGTTW